MKGRIQYEDKILPEDFHFRPGRFLMVELPKGNKSIMKKAERPRNWIGSAVPDTSEAFSFRFPPIPKQWQRTQFLSILADQRNHLVSSLMIARQLSEDTFTRHSVGFEGGTLGFVEDLQMKSFDEMHQARMLLVTDTLLAEWQRKLPSLGYSMYSTIGENKSRYTDEQLTSVQYFIATSSFSDTAREQKYYFSGGGVGRTLQITRATIIFDVFERKSAQWVGRAIFSEEGSAPGSLNMNDEIPAEVSGYPKARQKAAAWLLTQFRL